jgi:Tfp pilus assembly protein PilZ
MQMMEKRKLERFDLEIPSTIESLDQSSKTDVVESLTSNICSGGAYFKTNQPLAVGTEIKIDLFLPLNKFKRLKSICEKVHIDLRGIVLYSDPHGMGVCFDENYEIRPLKH